MIAKLFTNFRHTCNATIPDAELWPRLLKLSVCIRYYVHRDDSNGEYDDVTDSVQEIEEIEPVAVRC